MYHQFQINSVNPPPNDPVQPHHLFAHLLTWRPVEQAAFRGDDPHSLEKLRVGQRQLDHLPQTKAALFVHHERIITSNCITWSQRLSYPKQNPSKQSSTMQIQKLVSCVISLLSDRLRLGCTSLSSRICSDKPPISE